MCPIKELKVYESGVYVAAKPTAKTIARLAPLYLRTKEHGVRHPLDMKELHCTIMYSPKTRPVRDLMLTVKPARIFSAEVKDVRHLGMSISLMLESEDLMKAHERWKSLGLKSTYPEYLPHLALAYGYDKSGPSKKTLAALKELFVGMPVLLHHEYYAPLD